ncbi:MAG TPA: MFS transporter [Acidimicrobiia bacterium]|nr:MFS transporter [Acidimicrobiia bacterium]
MSLPAEGFRIRSLALPVYLPTFLFAVGQGAAIPILPLLALDMGLSVPIAGLLVGLRAFGNLLFDIPAGILVSRFGERKAMMFGAGLLSLVAAGIGTRPPLALLIVFVLLMGAAWSIWLLARLSYATEVSPLQHRGRVMSMMGGATRIGHFVGPLLGGLAVVFFGLSSAFFVQALLAVGAAIVLYRVSPLGGTDRNADRTSLRVVGRVLRDHRRIFATAGLVTIAIQIVRTSKDAMIPLWGNHIGLTPGQISLIFGLAYAADMTLFYPVGVVMDRFGRKWAGVPCLVMVSVGLIVIPFTRDFVALLLAGLLIGFGNGLGAGINMTLGSDFSPRGRRAEFLGAWRLIADVGSVSGPLLIAAVTSAASLAAAGFFAAAIGVTGAGILGWFVPETLLPPESVIEDT